MQPQVALAVSIWVEAVVYGIYVPLFFEAIYIMTKKRAPTAFSAKVFLMGSIVLFLLSSIDVAINLLRFLRAFVLNVEAEGAVVYFYDWTRWENTTHSSIIYLATWIGDALAIYRSYVVWDRRKWVIVVPLALLLVSIGINIMLFVWFTHPTITPPFNTTFKWLGTVYPLAFAENTITTGMIAFKVWKQHRESSALGVTSGYSVDLFTILRIIIESAMIYTIQLLILIIVFPMQSWVQAIVQEAIVPSIGIVFVLIAVRVHYSRSRLSRNPSAMIVPTWLDEPDSNSSSNTITSRARSSLLVGSRRSENKTEDGIRLSVCATNSQSRHTLDVELDSGSGKHLHDVDLIT